MNKYAVVGVGVLALSLILSGCTGDGTVQTSTNDSLNNQFEFIGRDMIDTTTTMTTLRHRDTGCHYVALSSKRSSEGVGGISPLLNSEGKPLCN